MQPHSPVESGFMPRKEFIRDQRTTNAFCLLAFSASSLIRLYSFPVPLIDALRVLFDHFYLSVAFRQDSAQNLCEFTLDAKPWASPKSVKTERIIVDILATIYRHGYSYVSTIDYGREHDDRLAIAFSRPSSPTPSPPHSMYPIPAGSGSNISHQTGSKPEKRVPFAISFVSAKILRVIYPPLHSTPAILQAVRASWPRGVVSEKKVGDASYEFKLKGYKWFQEDTFATDSLRHILSLLSSLDTHAFSLVASLSLSNRSRVKDLWIFTGAGSSDIPDQQCWPESPIATMSHSGSYPELKPNPLSIPEPPVYTPEKGLQPSHRRMVTAPSAPYHDQQGPFAPSHTPHFLSRAPTEKIKPPALITTSGLSSPGPAALRKPAPRAQLPVSVDLDAREEEDEDGEGEQHDHFNADLPSTIPSPVENMTGIGTMAASARRRFSSHLAYATSTPAAAEMDDDDEVFEQQTIDVNDSRYPTFQNGNARARSRSPSFQRRLSAFRPASRLRMSLTQSMHHTSQSLDSMPPHARQSTTSRDASPPSAAASPPPRHEEAGMLLSAGAFGADEGDMRVSAFSARTDATCEIPIKWTGTGVGAKEAGMGQGQGQGLHRTSTTTPAFPGGWASSPSPHPDASKVNKGDRDRTPSPPTNPKRPKHDVPGAERYTDRALQDVDARVASPEVVCESGEGARRSEAGFVGMMRSPGVSPTKSTFDRSRAGTNQTFGSSEQYQYPHSHLQHQHQQPQHQPQQPQQQQPQQPPRSPTKGASGCSTGTGHGWVLVNVEARANVEEHGGQSHTHSRTHSPSPAANGRVPKGQGGQGQGHASSMAAAAKATVVIDAKGAAKKSSNGGAKEKEKDRGKEKGKEKQKSKEKSPSSGLRGFLSLSPRMGKTGNVMGNGNGSGNGNGNGHGEPRLKSRVDYDHARPKSTEPFANGEGGRRVGERGERERREG
ncbi:hypothetical protein SERLA73DRAFT_161581 [Serpula lacrymans var. lacrymans S7.3]|uniref:HORMA domain-containing protein n=1 Tax=Serpula lacrymans var. lacrymans (strain S7.3) TaxID=936435 RepID=F8Q362_SERL3|nr:hypothetical protein SERLA73DRAFT_161581 [Serpula lacrymans var. lacrymans S7.3]